METQTATEAAEETAAATSAGAEGTAEIPAETAGGAADTAAAGAGAPAMRGETAAEAPGAGRPAREQSLLDDEPEETAAEEQPKEGAPTEEEMKAFRDGISAFDLGDGVRWDDEAFRAYQPQLMALTGGDPKKAEPLVRAHVAFMREQQKRADDAADAFNAGLIRECRARFGADLQKVAKAARVGGRTVFGERIWNEMKSIPAFANNPDIMEKLAEVGRMHMNDGGKTAPEEGGADRAGGDVLHRMYGNVRI